jgi:N-acyl-D-aspartate/D-glutamate deacylase
VTFDCVIRGGTVFDGRGAAPVRADVAVSDGRIAACGDVGDANGREIDATGLFVAPGFIDIHSHSDYTLLVDPRAVSALHQGVTLEVIGNCGHGCFPIRDPALATKAIYGYSDAVDLSWRTAGEYFDRLAAAMPAVNVMSLVPNGQLRLSTLGLADRSATGDELQTMGRLLEESLAEGAWGLSTGLEYATEAGATEAEIAALCRPVAEAGGFYATHTRQRDAGSAVAVAEALRVAEAARVRLQLSHLIPRSGPEEGTECIELVERAHARGVDVAFDMHTRRFGLTHLYAALPATVLAGSKDTLTASLRDRTVRERMKTHRSILSAGGDWTRVMLLDNPIWPQYARIDLASIAAERGQEPLDAVFDLLLEAVDDLHSLMVTIDCYTEGQQREAFHHGLCMPASDATTLAPDGPLAGSQFHGAYTWAAWFYRFMVREQRLLEPAEAIHRLTGLPAERLGLRDRGVLATGAQADIVVFDPEQYGERGTTFEPNQPATGVEHVFVNGVLSLSGGVLTPERAGQVLRRT